MATDILDVLEDAIALDEIQSAAEAFMTSKLSLFEGIDMDTALESQEQNLEWHSAYREYVSLMEVRVLAACAEAPDVTKEEILAQLSSLVETGEEGAEDRKHARFLLSMFEYSSFLSMMKELRRRSESSGPKVARPDPAPVGGYGR